MNLITVKQAATQVSLSMRRIRQLIKAGTLPATKVGRDYLIDPKALARVKVYGVAGRPKGS